MLKVECVRVVAFQSYVCRLSSRILDAYTRPLACTAQVYCVGGCVDQYSNISETHICVGVSMPF